MSVARIKAHMVGPRHNYLLGLACPAAGLSNPRHALLVIGIAVCHLDPSNQLQDRGDMDRHKSLTRSVSFQCRRRLVAPRYSSCSTKGRGEDVCARESEVAVPISKLSSGVRPIDMAASVGRSWVCLFGRGRGQIKWVSRVDKRSGPRSKSLVTSMSSLVEKTKGCLSARSRMHPTATARVVYWFSHAVCAAS